MKTAWVRKTKLDKTLFILWMTASIGAFVCALLRLFRVWDQGLNIAMPLLGTAMLFQSIQEWKKNRFEAILFFCAASFLFVSCAVVWFMK